MKLHEITDAIPTVMNITSANISDIVENVYKDIPKHLWEFTTPRSEVATFSMKEPTPENLKKILDEINASVSKAFLSSAENANRKYNK